MPVEFRDGEPHIAYEFAGYAGAPLRPNFVAMFDDCQKKFKQRKPNKPLHGTPAKAPSSSTEPESRRP